MMLMAPMQGRFRIIKMGSNYSFFLMSMELNPDKDKRAWQFKVVIKVLHKTVLMINLVTPRNLLFIKKHPNENI